MREHVSACVYECMQTMLTSSITSQHDWKQWHGVYLCIWDNTLTIHPMLLISPTLSLPPPSMSSFFSPLSTCERKVKNTCVILWRQGSYESTVINFNESTLHAEHTLVRGSLAWGVWGMSSPPRKVLGSLRAHLLAIHISVSQGTNYCVCS